MFKGLMLRDVFEKPFFLLLKITNGFSHALLQQPTYHQTNAFMIQKLEYLKVLVKLNVINS